MDYGIKWILFKNILCCALIWEGFLEGQINWMCVGLQVYSFRLHVGLLVPSSGLPHASIMDCSSDTRLHIRTCSHSVWPALVANPLTTGPVYIRVFFPSFY